MGAIAVLGGLIGSVNIFVPGMLRPGMYSVLYSAMMVVLLIIGTVILRTKTPSRNYVTVLVFCAFPVHAAVTVCVVDANLYSTPLMTLFGTIASALLLGPIAFAVNLVLLVGTVSVSLAYGWTGSPAGLIVQIFVQSSVLIAAAFAIYYMRRKAERSLEVAQRASRTDALTMLANRRAVTEFAPELVADARAQGHQVLCAVIDLDHFKRINDAHGHAAGDDVLVGVGDQLRRLSDAGSLAARLGGEEFLLVRQVTGLSHAQEMAGELHTRIRSTDGPISVTASIGVAVAVPTDGDGVLAQDWLWALISDADAALYCAKAAGRDTVRFHADAEPKLGNQPHPPDASAQPSVNLPSPRQLDSARRPPFVDSFVTHGDVEISTPTRAVN